MPPCPEHGTDQTRQVRRAGTYGSPPRQLFECRLKGPWKAPDGSRKRPPGTHRFAGELPRLLRDPGVCPHCDSEVARHQGPLPSCKYEFHLRPAAQAPVDVGAGKTYTQAALSGRHRKDSVGGHQVGIVTTSR
jgi:hypothetical protein